MVGYKSLNHNVVFLKGLIASKYHSLGICVSTEKQTQESDGFVANNSIRVLIYSQYSIHLALFVIRIMTQKI